MGPSHAVMLVPFMQPCNMTGQSPQIQALVCNPARVSGRQPSSAAAIGSELAGRSIR